MSSSPDVTAATHDPELSIVIPAYNEEQRLPATLERIQQYLAGRPWRYELLVVDDGSTDRTPQLVEQLASRNGAIRLLRYAENRGKGYAVRYGMQRARGERLLLSDADLSTPIEELEKLWMRLDRGADIAIGSRALPESDLAVHQPFLREMAGRTFNLVVRLLAVPGFADTQCGFKLFRREAAHRIFPLLTIDRWCFDVEALHVGLRLGYRIDEVPVTWRDSPNTKVNVLRDLRRTAGELLRLKWTWTLRDPRRLAERSGEGCVRGEARAVEAFPQNGP